MEKNYSSWKFQFSLYVKEKDLWGPVNDTTPALNKDKDKVEHSKWIVNDAQVMPWFIRSIDPNIVLNFHPYKTATTMWAYLKKIYCQNNATQRL